jgi:hypothetical protein
MAEGVPAGAKGCPGYRRRWFGSMAAPLIEDPDAELPII